MTRTPPQPADPPDRSSSQDLYEADIAVRGPQRHLRYVFFLFFVRPVMLIIMGMNVRHAMRLPNSGPALIVANHNSHLDALALITLFGMQRLHQVRPVAAADYFLRNRWMAWFSVRVLGILPLDRQVRRRGKHPLTPINDAIERNEIVLLFPEGSRGQPEQRQPLQQGIAHLAKLHPDVPIVPVFMHGLGKALPRGEGLLVPFICDIFVGQSMRWQGDKATLMRDLCQAFDDLENEASKPQYPID